MNSAPAAPLKAVSPVSAPGAWTSKLRRAAPSTVVAVGGDSFFDGPRVVARRKEGTMRPFLRDLHPREEEAQGRPTTTDHNPNRRGAPRRTARARQTADRTRTSGARVCAGSTTFQDAPLAYKEDHVPRAVCAWAAACVGNRTCWRRYAHQAINNFRVRSSMKGTARGDLAAVLRAGGRQHREPSGLPWHGYACCCCPQRWDGTFPRRGGRI